MQEYILKLDNIIKEYPGVRALDDISFDLKKGEVHALLGENGAGKSTLIKIITGAVKANSGSVIYNGEKFEEISPTLTLNKGIACIYQEFNLLPTLTVAENIFYGCEPKKGVFVDYKKMKKDSEKILSRIGANIDPNEVVKNLKVGQMQLVEIARALIKKVNVLIMDEPTASLTDGEIKNLFRIINELRDSGVGVVYISHKLEEVFEIADRITVFRDGNYVISDSIDKFNEKSLIECMVGRELAGEYPKSEYKISQEVLKVERLKTDCIEDVSFELNKGEILGFAGLVGSGRTEVARAIFGYDSIKSGKIEIKGKTVKIKSPQDSIKNGMAFITEDRKNLGLILNMSVKENLTFASLKKIKSSLLLNKKKEKELCEEQINSLKIKTSSINTKVGNLSGGNQQKVVIGKWLLTDSDIFIFDEPTRGIDVGAKQEIYKIMRKLTAEGKSIIMISSEMPELIGMSDRIIVMSGGRIVSQYDKENITQEKIFMDSAKER